MVWSATSEIVGASLTAVTVSTKVSEVQAPPVAASQTVRVMVVVPDWSRAGVMVTVRLAPLPPKTMLALGTSVVLDELPVTSRSAAAVSTSPTVKGMAAVAVSSAVVWSATSEIVGASLTAVTVMVTVALLESAF